MKQQINPAVAAAVIAGLVLVVGFFIWRGAGVSHDPNAKPPGMPADVAAEFNKRMGGVTGPTQNPAARANMGTTAPTAPTAPGN